MEMKQSVKGKTVGSPEMENMVSNFKRNLLNAGANSRQGNENQVLGLTVQNTSLNRGSHLQLGYSRSSIGQSSSRSLKPSRSRQMKDSTPKLRDNRSEDAVHPKDQDTSLVIQQVDSEKEINKHDIDSPHLDQIL